MMGKVYLVGAGPGAPDLLTLRAARLLESADIVLHDALVHRDTLALARRARLVDVGKRYGKVSTEQRFINRALVEAARTHAVVVRLKGGDPMLFGRAQEELEALEEAGIPCEVVPGVTAALAAAASLQVSLTRRGIARSVAFLTPRVGRGEGATEWLPAAMGADSVLLYMAAGASRAVSEQLVAAGKPASTPVALVESASLPEESRIKTTLGELSRREMQRATGPVVMAVGEVFATARPSRAFPKSGSTMTTADKYTTETITGVRPWTDNLFSFRTTRDPGYRFVPGQFARLGVHDDASGTTVWRAYSIASAHYDEHLEMRDRVTKLLASGVLEENIGVRLDHDRSRIMLCGNPDMVEDSRRILVERGFRISRRGDPGHLAVENYW